MVKLYNGGAYLINGNTLIEENDKDKKIRPILPRLLYESNYRTTRKAIYSFVYKIKVLYLARFCYFFTIKGDVYEIDD